MKNLSFLLLAVLISGAAFAHEAETVAGPDIEVPNKENLVNVKQFKSAKYGTVNVILRNDGEVVARPFLVDIRANCARGGNRDWKKLKNSRMQSACAMEKENVTYDEANDTIIVRYQDTDADDYNRQSKEPDIKSPVMKCKKKATNLRIPVADLCAVEKPAAPAKSTK